MKIIDSYHNYLKKLVGGGRIYSDLITILSAIPFTVIHPGDENRLADGLAMRNEFAQAYTLKHSDLEALDNLPCSVFEMMVALSVRMSNTFWSSPKHWFMEMLRNLRLDCYTVPLSDAGCCEIEDIIFRFLNRYYDERGHGGLFPLDGNPPMNMREVEIWWQMNWWLNEKYPEKGRL